MFLKIPELSIKIRLFYAVIVDGSDKFKKKICLALNCGILLSLSVCSRNGGDFVEQILRRFIFTKLKKVAQLPKLSLLR